MDYCLSQMPGARYSCELALGHFPETEHYAALSDGSFYRWSFDENDNGASLRFVESPKLPSEEVRMVDPDTGAAKGVKIERHDLIPIGALKELAVHYGKGESKYPSGPDGLPNWRKGYPWSQSYAALERHIKAFWEGEDYDEQTGSKHLIAAAWHCLALATFMDEQPEKDDRYSTLIQKTKA
jgi:Domain of unknown function (DUF5664)